VLWLDDIEGEDAFVRFDVPCRELACGEGMGGERSGGFVGVVCAATTLGVVDDVGGGNFA
tara:strand:+ start:1445 stop:1624 length:180 start_codon:yes stop_codon:yes gene_type:complete